MRRNIEEEDESDVDETPAPKKKGFPMWGWLLIGGGVLVLVCGGGGIAVVMYMGKKAGEAAKAAAANDTGGSGPIFGSPKKVVSRTELEKLLRSKEGNTAGKIKAIFGPPARTQYVGNAIQYEYEGITKDTAGSGKIDRLTKINFFTGGENVFRDDVYFVP